MITLEAFGRMHEAFQGFLSKVIFPSERMSAAQQMAIRKAVSIYAMTIAIALGFDADEALEHLGLHPEKDGREAMLQVTKMINEECDVDVKPVRVEVDLSTLTADDVFSAGRFALKTMLDMLDEGQRFGDTPMGQSTAGAIGVLSTVCFILSQRYGIPFEQLQDKLGLAPDIAEGVALATSKVREASDEESLRKLLEESFPKASDRGETKH